MYTEKKSVKQLQNATNSLSKKSKKKQKKEINMAKWKISIKFGLYTIMSPNDNRFSGHTILNLATYEWTCDAQNLFSFFYGNNEKKKIKIENVQLMNSFIYSFYRFTC